MRLPRFLSFAFFCALLPLVAQAQTTDLNSPLPFDPNVRTGKLPNGLTYYIRHNSKPEHRAELRLAVHAGSVLEDDDQQGLAHLNEHMSFNGTVMYPHNMLESFLEEHGARFGADLNAYTSFDETVYQESLPTDQGKVLDSGIDILGEWAHNNTFDSVEVEKERGVVGEEWRMGLGAFKRIQDKQFPIILAGSQYAKRNTIGLKPVIDTAHQSTIKRFYYDWYRPDLMAVIAVGDFDVDQVEQKIKALFTPLTNPPNERPRTEFPIPPHQETYVAINTDKEMPLTIFSMEFERPGTDELTIGDYRYNNFVTGLYEQMLNARIQEAIEKGEAPLTQAGVQDGAFIGHLKAFRIFAILSQDSIKAGITAVLSQVYRAEQTGFTPGELDRAKKTLLSGMEKQWQERDKTKNVNFTQEYIRNFLDKEPSPGIDYEYELYKKYIPGITLGEVNALSPKLMDNTSPVVMFEGPESAGFTPPTKDELIGIINTMKSQHYAAYDDKTSNAPLLATQPKPGKITDEKNIASVGVTVWQLSNGARVVLKPTDFKDDEILFHAAAPGGSSNAPDAEYMSAQSGDNIVENSGLAGFDATTLKKMLAGKEVSVSSNIGMLRQDLDGQSTKKDLETLFQLTYLYMTQPRYDSAASATWLSHQKSMLENMGKMPERAYSDTLQVTMAQHNYRARPQSEETLNEIDPQKAFGYYKTLFSDASGFTFYFVGNIDPKSLRPMVEKYLASLPSSNQHTTWKDLGINPPTGTIVKKVYKGEAQKSVVSIIFSGKKEFSRENRFKLSAMTQALQIKLREDIREDKSGVYYVGVSPSFQKIPHDQYQITINFGCDPARVDELVAEVMKQIDTITTQPIEATYIDRVQKIGKNELEVNLKDNRYWMSQLQDRYWNGIDPSTITLTEGNKLYDSITPQDIFQTAKEYFNRDNCVEVILYPEKKS
jgi:zinc protease